MSVKISQFMETNMHKIFSIGIVKFQNLGLTQNKYYVFTYVHCNHGAQALRSHGLALGVNVSSTYLD